MQTSTKERGGASLIWIHVDRKVSKTFILLDVINEWPLSLKKCKMCYKNLHTVQKALSWSLEVKVDLCRTSSVSCWCDPWEETGRSIYCAPNPEETALLQSAAATAEDLQTWIQFFKNRAKNIYRVRQKKVIPCRIWLISQQRIWIFIRKFTRLFYSHIYI